MPIVPSLFGTQGSLSGESAGGLCHYSPSLVEASTSPTSVRLQLSRSTLPFSNMQCDLSPTQVSQQPDTAAIDSSLPCRSQITPYQFTLPHLLRTRPLARWFRHEHIARRTSDTTMVISRCRSHSNRPNERHRLYQLEESIAAGNKVAGYPLQVARHRSGRCAVIPCPVSHA